MYNHFQHDRLAKKKNTESHDQGYLLYGKVEEKYLQDVLFYLMNLLNSSIEMFL